MAAWLSKVMHALTTLSDPHESARIPLQSAHDSRAKVTLELLSGGQPSVMSTLIEQVRDGDLIIDQPMVGGHTYPLAFDEQVRLNFTVDGVNYTGVSRCLGRIKIAAGDRSPDKTMYAYRLAMPKSLGSDDQRKEPRVQLGHSVAIEAQLYAPDSMNGPLIGQLLDVSMTGARVVTNMPVMFMFPGQSVFLKALMPEPVGLIDELVEIARITNEPKPGETSIGIQFRRKIRGLAELIRAQG